MTDIVNKALNEIKKVIIGKDEIILKVLTAFFSGGNILLEDSPGMGKTTLALALAKTFDLKFKRIQFTPDTVTADITGFSAYDPNLRKFIIHPGAAMTDLLLADEINRTSGKTQAALLEIMEEKNCTLDGETLKLSDFFTVIATQNPVGSPGTYDLPPSQLDRFMMKIKLGIPDKNSLKSILKSKCQNNPMNDVNTICSKEELQDIRNECSKIYVSEPIYEYISNICEETYKNKEIYMGISPRGAILLCDSAKANAYINGRDYVIPMDIRENLTYVCAHRIILSTENIIHGKSAENILDDIILKIPSPKNT